MATKSRFLGIIGLCLVSSGVCAQIPDDEWFEDEWWDQGENAVASSTLPMTVDELYDKFRLLSVQDLDRDGTPEAICISSEDVALNRALFLDFDEDGSLDAASLANGVALLNVGGTWQEQGPTDHDESAQRNSGGTEFRIRPVSGGEVGTVAAAGVITVQIEERTTGASEFISFTGIGLGIGLKGSGSGVGSWCEFSTDVTMSLSDFECFGRITSVGGALGIGGGYVALSFYPTDHPGVYVECAGLGSGLGLGASTLGGWWEWRD